MAMQSQNQKNFIWRIPFTGLWSQENGRVFRDILGATLSFAFVYFLLAAPWREEFLEKIDLRGQASGLLGHGYFFASNQLVGAGSSRKE